jgi:hypothetical protein
MDRRNGRRDSLGCRSLERRPLIQLGMRPPYPLRFEGILGLRVFSR